MKPETTDEQKDTTAQDIALALCITLDGWQPMTRTQWGGREVRHATGYGFHLSWREGRINVSGVYPKNAAGEEIRPRSYADTPAPSISVSPTKPGHVIAKDIQRRFLPEYLASWQQCVTRAAEEDRYQATTAASLAALRKATGCPAPRDQNRNMLHLAKSHAYALTASGTSIRFEAFSCPLAVALAILPLLTKPDDPTDD